MPRVYLNKREVAAIRVALRFSVHEIANSPYRDEGKPDRIAEAEAIQQSFNRKVKGVRL